MTKVRKMAREEIKKAIRDTKKETILANLHGLLSLVDDIPAYTVCLSYAIEKLEQEPVRKKRTWTNGNSICPCCGEDKFKDLDADIWADWQPKYCPNCGSKMESEEKEWQDAKKK